jgi:hypothetical protein
MLIRNVDLCDFEAARGVCGQVVRLCHSVARLVSEDQIVCQESVEHLQVPGKHRHSKLRLQRVHLIDKTGHVTFPYLRPRRPLFYYRKMVALIPCVSVHLSSAPLMYSGQPLAERVAEIAHRRRAAQRAQEDYWKSVSKGAAQVPDEPRAQSQKHGQRR